MRVALAALAAVGVVGLAASCSAGQAAAPAPVTVTKTAVRTATKTVAPPAPTTWTIAYAGQQYLIHIKALNDLSDRYAKLADADFVGGGAKAMMAQFISQYAAFARWISTSASRFPASARPYVEPVVQATLKARSNYFDAGQCSDWDCANQYLTRNDDNSAYLRLRIALGLPAPKDG